MSAIPITQLLPVENPWAYKLHAARESHGSHPLDVFVGGRDEWLGWNRWRGDKNEFSRDFIFSAIQFYPEAGIWLFGGIFRVLSRSAVKGSNGYEIEEVAAYSNLVGRLKIKMPTPSRGRAFYLENHYPGMFVHEILREPYSGAEFPGFENIVISFHELKSIIDTQKPDWKAALSGVKGVYCIHDRSNGKKYIGSAYGEAGIWSRWASYAWSGHGGNVHLQRAVADHGIAHVMNHFQIALLEYRPASTDDTIIIAREGHWKRLMLSRGDFGYNGN
jgi:hypothetical protein